MITIKYILKFLFHDFKGIAVFYIMISAILLGIVFNIRASRNINNVKKAKKRMIVYLIFAIITTSGAIYMMKQVYKEHLERFGPRVGITIQEAESMNKIFDQYHGNQTGYNLESLIEKTIERAKEYDDPAVVPSVILDTKKVEDEKNITIIDPVYKSDSETDGYRQQEYMDKLEALKKQIKLKTTYFVSLSYSEQGTISVIKITELPKGSLEITDDDIKDIKRDKKYRAKY